MNTLLNCIKEFCVPKEFENISDNTIIINNHKNQQNFVSET